MTEADLLHPLGLGSGVPRALAEWPRIDLVDDVTGNQFSAVIQCPEAEWSAPGQDITPQATDPVTDPVIALLRVLVDGPLPPSIIQKTLGLKHRPTFRENYLYRALEAGLIEMTIPEIPSSRLQKYRLTAAGQQLLQALRKEPLTP